MSAWNMARIASRRPLSKRKVHAPVGPPELLGDKPNFITMLQRMRSESGLDMNTVDVSEGGRLSNKCCGYHVCARIPGKCVPEAPRASTPEGLERFAGSGDFEWACARLLEGKTVMKLRSEDQPFVVGFRIVDGQMQHAFDSSKRWFNNERDFAAWKASTIRYGDRGYSQSVFALGDFGLGFNALPVTS